LTRRALAHARLAPGGAEAFREPAVGLGACAARAPGGWQSSDDLAAGEIAAKTRQHGITPLPRR